MLTIPNSHTNSVLYYIGEGPRVRPHVYALNTPDQYARPWTAQGDECADE